MRIVRWSHSCVRLERDGAVLVIDPGVWSEPEAAQGADAVLLTHEHAYHVDVERVRHLTCPVCATPQAVGINDGQIDARAVGAINAWYDRASPGRYRYVEPGTAVPESRP